MSVRILPELLDEAAARFADRPAVDWVVASGRAGFTYRALQARARRGAAVLRAAGTRPGDRVLIVMDGCPEWAAAFFAVLQGGFVAVPLPASTPPESLAAIARHAGARSRIHLPGKTGTSRDLDRVCALTTQELFAAGKEVVDISPARPEAVALLAFTSGSTAKPRAVELCHAPLLAELRALLRVLHAYPSDALLSVLPPAHLFELVAGLLAPLWCGARVVYPGTLLPNRLVEALRENGITRTLAVPAVIEALYREILEELADAGLIEPGNAAQRPVEAARRMQEGLTRHEAERIVRGVRERIGPSFHTLGVGGAALDPIWTDVLAPFGITLEIGYGLTEAGPIVSLGSAAACPRGSAGRALPGIEVRVDGRGEILIRTPYGMRGYFGDPDGTASALQHGWLHTGDRGRLDPEGFLFVTGRLKEAIVTASGETLDPEEVEPYYQSPLFSELCVVPRRGEDGNDVPTIVVVPARPDVSDAELERAIARLRAAAPARCRVVGFVRLERLPRTDLGKIRRRVLAEALAAREVGP